MVHNKRVPEPMPRRGRPRSYDPDVALDHAMELFWKTGYAATSLDELSAATGMNRPSLYAAFGDKKTLYRKALTRYRTLSREAMGDAFTRSCTLRERMHLIFSRALDLYMTSDGARGCFSVVSAASDAIVDPDIQQLVVDSIEGLDRTFTRILETGIEDGELPEGTNAAHLAQIATATLHTLSVRARAGLPKRRLKALIDGTVTTICGPA